MSRTKRLLSILLALICAFTLLSVPAFAANGERYIAYTDTAERVAAKRLELEQKYAVSITYPTYGNGTPAIYPETLDTLDTALSYVTPYFVQLISQYYQQTTGYRLQISYRTANMNGDSTSDMTVAGFDDKSGLMVLYIPQPGSGAVVSGDAPMTIIHELGHAMHLMLIGKHGLENPINAWLGYNAGYSYNTGNIAKNPNSMVFASGYAATEYYEDVAETFAYGFVSNRAGMGLSGRMFSGGNATSFGRKIATMEWLLTTYFPDATQMHANFRKSQSAAVSVSWQGLVFSGSYLQFAGYAEPRYLPTSFLTQFSGIPESGYTWVPSLGGWTATNVNQSTVVVFPDLYYQTAG